MISTQILTPLNALIATLEDAASYNANAEVPPRAILWCDPGREFQSLLPLLRERLPQLLTLGDYDPATRTGPAVWLRVAADRLAKDITWPENKLPILYLPGHGREVLRGAEDCPLLLQPLVWYTLTGCLFGHVNGKDWNLRGFLSADRGNLRLDIAEDAATKEALRHAATRFCTQDVQSLRGKRWDSGALHALLAPDLSADMLDWMEGILIASQDEGRFAAFSGLAIKELKFDPRKLSRQDAAHELVQLKGNWKQVWQRFERSTGYAGVVQLLRSETPLGLFADKAPYPRLNEECEIQLRDALKALSSLNEGEAKAQIIALDLDHAWRRDTVWSKRGEAPLANALAHLAIIAKAKALPPQDGMAFGQAYQDWGASIDWAACQASAIATRQVDREAVTVALRAIYLPWLEDGANALQNLVQEGKVRLASPKRYQGADTLVFVDGLRMDIAQALVALLADEGIPAKLSWVWSGFPSVTATCKNLASPIADSFVGPSEPAELVPETAEGKAVIKSVLYKALESSGWKTQPTLLPSEKLWIETGRFDEEGHALGAALVDRLTGGLRDVADCIIKLVRNGRTIRIVTDHGWLLMPGGLPSAALDPGLVETKGKRYRYALIKSAAQSSYLQVPWSWNEKVFVAAATGVRVFLLGEEYAHGGISPQECVLPVLEIDATSATPSVSIQRASWEGLRLRVEISGGADLKVDVRLGESTNGQSLVKGGRVLDADGRTAILVSDEYDKNPACLVVLNDDGNVLAHRRLIIGGD